MKKLIILMGLITMFTLMFTGCGNQSQSPDLNEEVVVTQNEYVCTHYFVNGEDMGGSAGLKLIVNGDTYTLDNTLNAEVDSITLCGVHGTFKFNSLEDDNIYQYWIEETENGYNFKMGLLDYDFVVATWVFE